MFQLHGITWGRNWRVFGMPMIQRHRGSVIRLGSGLGLRSWYSTNPLAPNHPVVISTRSRQARITVGKDCGFTGATLVAVELIEIGDRAVVGANAIITDTDFHPIDPAERRRDLNNGLIARCVLATTFLSA